MSGKSREPGDVRVRDVMTHSVEAAHLHEAVDTALDRMIAQNASLLPVVDGDRLVGLISAAEIRSHAGELAETSVSDLAALGAYHCLEHDSAAAAAKTMNELGVAHLAVLDEDHNLVGMVGAQDLGGAPANRAQPIDQRTRRKEADERSNREAFEAEHPGLQVYSDRPRLKP